ncbi:MAG: response regulator [Waterburya sp.]
MLIDEQSEPVNIRKDTLLSKPLLSIIKTINVDKLKFSGYLEIKLHNNHENNNFKIWYLFFSRGKVVFSGSQLICFSDILSALKSYIPNLRNNQLISFEEIEKMTHRANVEKDILVVGLLGELALNIKTLNYKKIVEAIESHIIEDTERYLFHNAQEVKIFSNLKIDDLRPIVGLDVEELFSKIMMRRSQWKKIETIIPSLNYHIQCNTTSPQWSQLSSVEKNKIEKLCASGNTLEEVRYKLGEDSLKIAQIFSKLIEQKLVLIDANRNSFPKIVESSIPKDISKSSKAELVIIDDSSVLLKQFSSVVKDLGYGVKCCDNSLEALDLLLKHEPRVIFIDINMPELSGFQLMKLIRTNPKLSSTPLVILTAEKTMINQQRAKWSKSKFLSKPLNLEDRERFVTELKDILHSIAPLK